MALLLLLQAALSVRPSLRRAHELHNWTVGVRRELHASPELLYELHRTAALVARTLDELGIPYTDGIGRTGIVATLGAGRPAVGLRADMDALPIEEVGECEYKSKEPGKMHACGHDAHTAMLLTAARMLKERESELMGTIKLIFQPAEEGVSWILLLHASTAPRAGAGGLRMIQEGVLATEPPIERMYALHVWPGLSSGTIASRAGTLMAAAGFFHARFIGHGGHAAMPHTTTDPLLCLSSALTSVQTVVARNTAPVEAAVVSTTFVSGGSAYNIIPDEAVMGGAEGDDGRRCCHGLQELSPWAALAILMKPRAAMLDCRLELITSSLHTDCLRQAAPEGAPGSCTFPPTVNDAGAWELAKQAARELTSVEDVIESQPTMGGEDFAYFLEKVPGAMLFLGIGNVALRSIKELRNGPALSKLGCSRLTTTDDSSTAHGQAATDARCAQGTAMEAED
ncbi:MAG: hypothetical protein SGPRY_006498 [Prymnesium sp.]